MLIKNVLFYKDTLGCILSGIDYKGGDFGGVIFTDTKEKCQIRCQDTSGCLYFTWVGDEYFDSSIHKKCFLKNQLIERNIKTVKGLYSGPKFCKGNLVLF